MENRSLEKKKNVKTFEHQEYTPQDDEVRLLARNTNVVCLCLSETWLDYMIFDAEVHIANYSLRRKDRNRNGGGVAIYIRSDIAFSPRDDLNHDLLEATFVDILLPKTKPILCGSIYRVTNQA